LVDFGAKMGSDRILLEGYCTHLDSRPKVICQGLNESLTLTCTTSPSFYETNDSLSLYVLSASAPSLDPGTNWKSNSCDSPARAKLVSTYTKLCPTQSLGLIEKGINDDCVSSMLSFVMNELAIHLEGSKVVGLVKYLGLRIRVNEGMPMPIPPGM
jgi:hypothetical protein